MGPFGDSNNRNYFLHDYNINKYLHQGEHNILKVSVYSTYNVIGNYFIGLTQKGIRLEDGKADRLFPTATKCYNDLTNNIRNITSNPPNNPFPPSDTPLNPNNNNNFPPDTPLNPNDINNFFKDHNGVPGPYNGNDIPLPNGYPPELTPKQKEQIIYDLTAVAILILIIILGTSGAAS